MGTEAAAAGPPSSGPAELLGGQRPAGRGALSPTLWSVEEAGLGTACAATSAHSFGREASPVLSRGLLNPRAMALVLGKASRPLRVSVQVHCLGKPGVTAALVLLAAAAPQDGLQSPAEGWTLPVGVARVAGDWGLAWPLCHLAGWKDDGATRPPSPAGSRPGTGRQVGPQEGAPPVRCS